MEKMKIDGPVQQAEKVDFDKIHAMYANFNKEENDRSSKPAMFGKKQEQTNRGTIEAHDNTQNDDEYVPKVSREKILSMKDVFDVLIEDEVIATFGFESLEECKILFFDETNLIDEMHRLGADWLKSRVSYMCFDGGKMREGFDIIKIINSTHLVSVYDSLWIKDVHDSELTWSKVNPSWNDFANDEIEDDLLLNEGITEQSLNQFSTMKSNPNFVNYIGNSRASCWVGKRNEIQLLSKLSEEIHSSKSIQTVMDAYKIFDILGILTVALDWTSPCEEDKFNTVAESYLAYPTRTVRFGREIFGDDIKCYEKFVKLCSTELAQNSLERTATMDALLGYCRDYRFTGVTFDTKTGAVADLQLYHIPLGTGRVAFYRLADKDGSYAYERFKFFKSKDMIDFSLVTKCFTMSGDSRMANIPLFQSVVRENARFLCKQKLK